METLISDPNRSIATLAITTLLKTGNESSIERLLKQIGGFMNEIADEFKMQVVSAIRNLCIKYPQKHRQMLHFLSNNLREEGGFDYKKAIVDAILAMVQQIPEAKERALAHLCEFIEDCEYTYLAAQILHLLVSRIDLIAVRFWKERRGNCVCVYAGEVTILSCLTCNASPFTSTYSPTHTSLSSYIHTQIPALQ